jgi:translation initiation factor 2B subunit (eIF-2B alpha/beta/delta family)
MIDCILGKKVKDSTAFLKTVKRYSDDWKDVNDRIVGNFIAKVSLKGKTVLLHSHSSAIISLFEKVREDAGNINIIQTESRPVYEGRLQAKRLAGQGYKVRLVTDTGFTPLLDDIDYAILGADRIYNDFFINKTGSYAIALLCREKAVPLYVLADSRKILNIDLPAGYKEKMRPAGEVWNSPPSGITPINYYFEAVPVDLITRLITEK